MKLATYADGSRDGQLVVVSRDLSQAHYATHIANRLAAVLDDWNYLAPQLQDLYDNLNAGRARHAFAFDPARCLAPLPRTHTLVQAQAYPHHGELLVRGAATPGAASAQADEPAPALQALPAGVLGACRSMPEGLHEALEVDFEAQIAVVTADVGADCGPERALDSVRLLMLAHCTVLRALERSSPGQGLAARPMTAFAPVAVTPDELGEAWARGRMHLGLVSSLNGRKVGMADCGADMQWSFGQLVQRLCSLRALAAGTILTSGAVCNRGQEKRGRMEWPKGFHSLAQRRGMEAWLDGSASTGYLRRGDTVASEVRARDGSSLFGSIEQTLGERASSATAPQASASAQLPPQEEAGAAA
ncbi:MAG: fumarylacetoacetate hydrolase family protein [Rhodoferax sp.]